eukprot:SAG31_NODE_733_length_12491_cov_7.073112_11_plen_68_part_00
MLNSSSESDSETNRQSLTVFDLLHFGQNPRKVFGVLLVNNYRITVSVETHLGRDSSTNFGLHVNTVA